MDAATRSRHRPATRRVGFEDVIGRGPGASSRRTAPSAPTQVVFTSSSPATTSPSAWVVARRCPTSTCLSATSRSQTRASTACSRRSWRSPSRRCCRRPALGLDGRSLRSLWFLEHRGGLSDAPSVEGWFLSSAAAVRRVVEGWFLEPAAACPTRAGRSASTTWAQTLLWSVSAGRVRFSP